MSQLLALASCVDAAVQLASTLHRFVYHRLETCVNCILVQIQHRSWLLHSVTYMYCDALCIINCKNLKSTISTNLSGITLNHMQLSVLHIVRISLSISRFYHFSGPLMSLYKCSCLQINDTMTTNYQRCH